MKKIYFDIAVGAFGLGFRKDRDDQYSATNSMWSALVLLMSLNLLTIVGCTLDLLNVPRTFLDDLKYPALGILILVGVSFYWWLYLKDAKKRIEQCYRGASTKEKRTYRLKFALYGIATLVIFFTTAAMG